MNKLFYTPKCKSIYIYYHRFSYIIYDYNDFNDGLVKSLLCTLYRDIFLSFIIEIISLFHVGVCHRCA